MTNRTEGELLRSVRDKNRDALEQLYDRHARLVYSFAMRISSDESLAREIVQLVFARLWTTKAEYDSSRGDFASWLLTITRNIAIDVLRRERRHRSMVAIEGLHEQLEDAGSDSPEGNVIRSDQQSAINSAAKRLSRPQQQLINLMYWKGYTLHEIAEMGGEPVGTVKNRLHQALKTLRRHLQGLREEH
jgi:RNA polymerase sigma-70 factor (ECF subfamily)